MRLRSGGDALGGGYLYCRPVTRRHRRRRARVDKTQGCRSAGRGFHARFEVSGKGGGSAEAGACWTASSVGVMEGPFAWQGGRLIEGDSPELESLGTRRNAGRKPGVWFELVECL